MQINELLKEKRFIVKSRAKHSFEALGEEIRDYFHCRTNEFWWLFYRVDEYKIRQAFNEVKRQGKGLQDLIRYAKSIK